MPKIELHPIEHTKKYIYEAIMKDPITWGKFGSKGVVRVKETQTVIDPETKRKSTKDFYYYFDPDTFRKLQQTGNLNPTTRNPMTDWTLLSPPSPKKREYSAAAKVIQRHARAYLAKKEANQDPTTLMKNYSIRYKLPQYRVGMVGLTYKGKLFRLDFGADWTPKRAPKVITLKGFDCKRYRELPNDAAEDQMLSHFLCRKLKKYEMRVAPGDIIDMDFQERLNYFYYITHKGTIKELPSDDMSHPTYIPKDAMRAFYDHRNDSPELALIYKKAIQYYWRFLRNMGGNYGTEYVVHQYREGDETLQYYTIDSATQEPVIKTSSPLHVSAYTVPSSIRTPSPLGAVQGGAARETRKKKSNT